MVEMRTARHGDRVEQGRLWGVAFGDTGEYIGRFHRSVADDDDTLLLLDRGRLASMLYLIPVELVDCGGLRHRSAYIYAFCTHPDFRLKGFGGELLNYADHILKERGYDGACLVPARPSLHNYFARHGYAPMSSISTCTLTHRELALAGEGKTEGRGGLSFGTASKLEVSGCGSPCLDDGGEIRRADAGEYNAVRRTLLAGTPYADYGDALMDYQRELCDSSGGGLYIINMNTCRAAAIVERYGDCAVVKELLVRRADGETQYTPDELRACAALIGRVCAAGEYRVRTPLSPRGGGVPFAMAKGYRGDVPPAYFALALD